MLTPLRRPDQNTEGTAAGAELTGKRRLSPLFPLWFSAFPVVKIGATESWDDEGDYANRCPVT